MDDILVLLSRSASGLTFDELSADRVLAAEEIKRLRAEIVISKGSVREEPRPPKAPTNDPLVRLIRLPELMKTMGLSRSTIYKMMTDGKFPKPVRVGLRASAWKVADVLAWQAGLERG